MPLVVAFITFLFGSKVRDWLWANALYIAYAAASLAVVTAFVTSIFSIVSEIYVAIPQMILNVWFWVIPTNAVPVVTAVYSVQILRSMYDYKQKLLLSRLKVSA